jgi:hypothetical protein
MHYKTILCEVPVLPGRGSLSQCRFVELKKRAQIKRDKFARIVCIRKRKESFKLGPLTLLVKKITQECPIPFGCCPQNPQAAFS